ncbi:uncharacterized protein LOC132753807 [Ruditapes philippinarum]|uniref:uncharacterized protein LOC132753807 n=1 Tax=Ruditapes philippinarum TaxID=129788 RepID=UPI00295B72B3|nr:uncharacterized protein LOC132753807 [Ruditapes philippinarum]
MIDINSTNLGNTYFKCFVNDVPGNLEDSSVCNTETTTLPGKVYLRRTRGRFFTFAMKANITGDVSFQVYVPNIEAQNGEPCFESILIDDKQGPNTQITVSSGTTTQISTNTNTILTGWIHDALDLTPWILIDLIAATKIEGVGVYVSQTCDMWTTFNLYFGNNMDTLQLYKDMEFEIFPPENWWNIDQVFILPRPINGRYAKFKHSLVKPTGQSRCLNFKLFGCKMTRIIDINSDKSSEMLPLEHELQSGVSTFLKTNRTRCIELCSSQNSCSVASFNSSYDKLNGSDNEHHEPPEQIGNCYHYLYSPLGLWKIKTITDDVHWFAKIRNIVHMMSFPRAKRKNGLFFGHVQYVDTDSIITSLSYPFRTILESDLQWIVNFEPHQFAKLVFTNVFLSECALVVKTSQMDNNEFIIDENFNNEVFVIETNTGLLFITTSLTRVWPPAIKFRAIITAEETAACLSIDSLSHSKRTKQRHEICTEPTMILTTLSALNLCRDCEEKFTIQAGKHQSIDITFIYWDSTRDCVSELYSDDVILTSEVVIKDGDDVVETYCFQPEKYKSKGSMIHIQILDTPLPNRVIKGFRLQYKISKHSLQRYTTTHTTKYDRKSGMLVKSNMLK